MARAPRPTSCQDCQALLPPLTPGPGRPRLRCVECSVSQKNRRKPKAICVDCGSAVSGSRVVRCKPCDTARRREPWPCPGCGTEVYFQHIKTDRKYCTDDCRRAHNQRKKLDGCFSRIPWAECEECAAPIIKRRRRTTCGADCSRARSIRLGRQYYRANYQIKVRNMVCPSCSEGFTITGMQGFRVFCSEKCRRASPGYKVSQQAARRRRRALKQGALRVPYKDQDIYRRDRYRCGLCGKMTLRDRTAPDDWAPTIDHVLPFAKGGHDTPDNIQCAHFICNSYKGDRPDLTIQEMRAWVIPRLLRDRSKWDVAYAGIDDWNAA